MWTCQNNLDFSLCTVLFVCYIVTTLDNLMKSESVRTENNRLDFYFIFSYFLEYKMKKTKCDTITGHRSHKSHAHMIQKRT